MKNILIFLILYFLNFGALLTFVSAQNIEILPVQGGEITGTIESINYETSIIILRSYMDRDLSNYSNEKIYVLHEAIIEEEGKTIQLNDLTPGQNIVVQYNIGGENRKEAARIWVK